MNDESPRGFTPSMRAFRAATFGEHGVGKGRGGFQDFFFLLLGKIGKRLRNIIGEIIARTMKTKMSFNRVISALLATFTVAFAPLSLTLK